MNKKVFYFLHYSAMFVLGYASGTAVGAAIRGDKEIAIWAGIAAVWILNTVIWLNIAKNGGIQVG